MTRSLGFTPSQMVEGHYALAICERCHDHRYLGRAYMIEKAGDVPLDTIARRLRCFARPRSNKRGPACGGPMSIMEMMGPVSANAYHPNHRRDGP